MGKTFDIKRRENAPEWVVGSFGFKYEDLKPYVNDKGWVNFDILENKKGEQYIKVSEYGIPVKTSEEEIPF